MAGVRVLLSILALAALFWPGPSVEPISPADDEAAEPDASLDPWFRVRGGTPEQWAMMADARDRFVDAGLALPNLDVVFSEDPGQCQEALGLFSPDGETWVISICNEHVTSVYLHELAHAWARLKVPVSVQLVFLELRGLKTWGSKDVPWGERGTEVAANVIAVGLADPGFGLGESGIEERLLGFRELTGIDPPRLSKSPGLVRSPS